MRKKRILNIQRSTSNVELKRIEFEIRRVNALEGLRRVDMETRQ
jgi:hypothetical protein